MIAKPVQTQTPYGKARYQQLMITGEIGEAETQAKTDPIASIISGLPTPRNRGTLK